MAGKEYIDREALLNYPITRDNYDTKNGNIHFIDGIESILEYAESLPSADVQEVRHGKWIYISRSPEWADCVCSECGYTDLFPNNMECFYNYCPHCGAKMDKG